MRERRRELRVTFEDRALDALPPWRELDPWEEAVLRRHLAVDFDVADRIRSLTHWPRVREMDECGCLEFELAGEPVTSYRIVTDGYGPNQTDGSPFQTMLSLTGDGRLLWLEFHRFGGDASFRPDPSALRLFRFGTGWDPDA